MALTKMKANNSSTFATFLMLFAFTRGLPGYHDTTQLEGIMSRDFHTDLTGVAFNEVDTSVPVPEYHHSPSYEGPVQSVAGLPVHVFTYIMLFVASVLPMVLIVITLLAMRYCTGHKHRQTSSEEGSSNSSQYSGHRSLYYMDREAPSKHCGSIGPRSNHDIIASLRKSPMFLQRSVDQHPSSSPGSEIQTSSSNPNVFFRDTLHPNQTGPTLEAPKRRSCSSNVLDRMDFDEDHLQPGCSSITSQERQVLECFDKIYDGLDNNWMNSGGIQEWGGLDHRTGSQDLNPHYQNTSNAKIRHTRSLPLLRKSQDRLKKECFNTARSYHGISHNTSSITDLCSEPQPMFQFNHPLYASKSKKKDNLTVPSLYDINTLESTNFDIATCFPQIYGKENPCYNSSSTARHPISVNVSSLKSNSTFSNDTSSIDSRIFHPSSVPSSTEDNDTSESYKVNKDALLRMFSPYSNRLFMTSKGCKSLTTFKPPPQSHHQGDLTDLSRKWFTVLFVLKPQTHWPLGVWLWFQRCDFEINVGNCNFSFSFELALELMLPDFGDADSTVVQVMAW